MPTKLLMCYYHHCHNTDTEGKQVQPGVEEVCVVWVLSSWLQFFTQVTVCQFRYVLVAISNSSKTLLYHKSVFSSRQTSHAVYTNPLSYLITSAFMSYCSWYEQLDCCSRLW